MTISPFREGEDPTAGLAVIAAEIRTHMAAAVASIVDVGNALRLAKANVPHGTFLSWVLEEFGWSPSTAQRYMRVSMVFSTTPAEAFQTLPARALYALSSPWVTDQVREKVLDVVRNSGSVTAITVERLLLQEKLAMDGDVEEEPSSAPDLSRPSDTVSRTTSPGPRPTNSNKRPTEPVHGPPSRVVLVDGTGRTVPSPHAALWVLMETHMSALLRISRTFREEWGTFVADFRNEVSRWETVDPIRFRNLVDVRNVVDEVGENMFSPSGLVTHVETWAAGLLPFHILPERLPFPWINRSTYEHRVRSVVREAAEEALFRVEDPPPQDPVEDSMEEAHSVDVSPEEGLFPGSAPEPFPEGLFD